MLVIAAVPFFYDEANSNDPKSIVATTEIPVPLAFAAGFFVASLIAHFLNDGDGGDSNIDPSSEYQEQAMDFALFAETHFADISGGLAIDTQVWEFTQMYWDRVAEVSAASIWEPAADVETLINAILDDAQVLSSMMAIYRSWESVIDVPLYGMSDIPVLNDAAGYTEMEWGIYADDAHYVSEYNFLVDSGSYVRPYGANNTVYLSTIGSDSNQSMNRIYVFETMTLIHESGQRTILTPGVYSISSFSDGIYSLAGGEAVGPFIPVGRNSADVIGAMALDIDGVHGYIIPTDSGYTFRLGDTVVQAQDAGMYSRYPGDDGTVTDDRTLTGVLDAWDGLLHTYASILSSTAENIRAAWMLYDSLGTSDSQLPVSVWTPDLENLDLTAEQRYAIALLSMLQASDLVEAGMDNITSSDMKISGASMELMVTGDILGADGSMLAEDVVFTPFCYVRDQTVTVGGSPWQQSGFAIVWGSVSEWDGQTEVSKMSVIPLDSGCALRADSITYKGESVSSVTLEVESMELVLSEFEDIYVPEPIPETTDWGSIATLILAITAACLMLVGLYTRNPTFLLLAAIVAAIAVFGSDMVGRLLSRVF